MSTEKKRYSTLSFIREMQIKTTKRYYYTPIEMTKRKSQTTSIDEDVEKLEASCVLGQHVKPYGHLGRQFGSFLES